MSKGLDALGLDALRLDALGLDALGLDALGLDDHGLDDLGLDDQTLVSLKTTMCTTRSEGGCLGGGGTRCPLVLHIRQTLK